MQLGWFDWLAFTIPSMMLFGIAYFFIQGWLNTQSQIESQKTFRAQLSSTLPMKLQALERLSLFLERIRIDQLILRMKRKDLTAGDLTSLMLLTIQQEFEHNLTQQVYVSEQLWQIILMAKAQNEAFILGVGQKVSEGASGDLFMDALSQAQQERADLPLNTALKAIRTEAQKHLGA